MGSPFTNSRIARRTVEVMVSAAVLECAAVAHPRRVPATFVDQRLLTAGECATAAHPGKNVRFKMAWRQVSPDIVPWGSARVSNRLPVKKNEGFQTFGRRPCRFDAEDGGDRRGFDGLPSR